MRAHRQELGASHFVLMQALVMNPVHIQPVLLGTDVKLCRVSSHHGF